MTNNWGFETRQIHAGQVADPTTGARAVPVYRTTSYVFRDAQHAQNLFALAEIGNIYTRIMNPTQGVLEARLSSLEGGTATAVGLPGALAVSSGQSAELLAILTLAEAGAHIVASPSLYGGTYNLFHYTLPKLGIEVTFVDDPDNLDQWRAAAKPNTKAFYGEVLANPRNNVLDIEGISKVAHEVGVPLIVDNTVPTPYLIRPIEWGADIVVHSTSVRTTGSRTSPNQILRTTALLIGQHLVQVHTSSRHACKCCATWAWQQRQTMRSTSCKDLKHCRCAWNATGRTHKKLVSSWPSTHKLKKCSMQV